MINQSGYRSSNRSAFFIVILDDPSVSSLSVTVGEVMRTKLIKFIFVFFKKNFGKQSRGTCLLEFW